MNLAMSSELALGYRSRCQIARRITEHWAERELYCVACDKGRMTATTVNTKVVDFVCENCASDYQLKSSSRAMEKRVVDGAYSAMAAAIEAGRVPNLLLLHYSPDWFVQNLTLIPSFLFNGSIVERRNPLGPTARRAGWVGCNILIDRLPQSGRIQIVKGGVAAPPQEARRAYQALRPIENLAPAVRGWTLDVLRVVQKLNRREFGLADVYAYDRELAEMYPNNRNVRPKIRQQLQVLRDLGLINFLGAGRYSLARTIT